jgi:hypothetical protein
MRLRVTHGLFWENKFDYSSASESIGERMGRSHYEETTASYKTLARFCCHNAKQTNKNRNKTSAIRVNALIDVAGARGVSSLSPR